MEMFQQKDVTKAMQVNIKGRDGGDKIQRPLQSAGAEVEIK